jgi:putative oxidoreductase
MICLAEATINFGMYNQNAEVAMETVLLIGRILFSVIFIFNGFNHLADFPGVRGYAEAMGVPMAGFATIVTGLMLLAGGLSVLLGYKAKFGSLLLVIFLFLSAFMVHTFWAFEGQQAQVEMAQFFKNLALAGAGLMLMYFGSGPKSLEKKQA